MSQVSAPPTAAPRCRQTGEKQPQFLAAVPAVSSRPSSPTTPPLSPGRVRVSRKCWEAVRGQFLSLSGPAQPCLAEASHDI